MKYKDIDKSVARFALQNGYRIETAWKKLLWKYMENTRVLTGFLKLVKEGLEKTSVLDEMLEKEQLEKLNRIIQQTEEDSWGSTEKGSDEGPEDGVNDFEEVGKRKNLSRKEGVPVLSDGLKKGK